MKAKLYLILTGLLMAACVTSYGQEIVGEFTLPMNAYGSSDIAEASDGSLLIGSRSGEDYMVYKLSLDGIVIDSIALHDAAHGYYELLEIPALPDRYIFVNNVFYPYYVSFRFILIDANLSVISDVSTDFHTAQSYAGFTYFFITPDSNVATVYSKDEGNGPVGHYLFFKLDGTVVKDILVSETPNYAGYEVPATDTLLSHRFLEVFSETPPAYCRLGTYTLNGSIHIVNYIMDCDFNLINRIEYTPIAPNMPFSSTSTRVIPYNQANATAHLLQAYTPSNKPTLIKYDNEGNPIAFHQFSQAVNVAIKDENTLYVSYGSYSGQNQFGASQHVVRLVDDLESAWEITLPCPDYYKHAIQSIKALQNGDIVVKALLDIAYDSSVIQIFIIRDNDPTGTPETLATETPFTLYPNPVKDQLILRFDDGTEPESVELYDLAGRFVSTKRNGLESIEMSAMPSGVYMLRITMKDGTSYHEKVLKE